MRLPQILDWLAPLTIDRQLPVGPFICASNPQVDVTAQSVPVGCPISKATQHLQPPDSRLGPKSVLILVDGSTAEFQRVWLLSDDLTTLKVRATCHVYFHGSIGMGAGVHESFART